MPGTVRKALRGAGHNLVCLLIDGTRYLCRPAPLGKSIYNGLRAIQVAEGRTTSKDSAADA